MSSYGPRQPDQVPPPRLMSMNLASSYIPSRAANSMNALQKISSDAAKIEREMSPAEYEEFANLYRLVRVELNSLYELLPPKEKDKYYGYFVAVTEYEKKIAEGVYNPDLDGVLKFE